MTEMIPGIFSKLIYKGIKTIFTPSSGNDQRSLTQNQKHDNKTYII